MPCAVSIGLRTLRVVSRGLLAACAVFATAGAPGVAGQSLRESFDLEVPRTPIPVPIDGRIRLAYELHVTNFARVALELTRLEVVDGNDPGRLVAAFRDERLRVTLGRPGLPSGDAEPHVIAPGLRAVVYLWLTVEASPATLLHRLTFREPAAPDKPDAVVAGGRVVVREDAPVVLGPPLRGGPWVAAYDPSMPRGHRQVLIALGGEARIPARFAIDWVKVDANGRFAAGDRSRVAEWYGYDAEVLAVADAVVEAVRDSVAEAPTVALIAHGLDKANGNYVTLDLGAGRYVSYEHLKPGSVLVRPGDRVRAGQVIARVGNTGDSIGPHLHFHVSDGSTPLTGEGLPFVIRSFDVVGAFASIGAVGKEPWTPLQAGEPGARQLEMPAANTVIRFGNGR